MITDSDHSDQENVVGDVVDDEGSDVSDDVDEIPEADEIPESTAEAVPFDRNLPAAHRKPIIPYKWTVNHSFLTKVDTAAISVKQRLSMAESALCPKGEI
jgi:hypothetical protein